MRNLAECQAEVFRRSKEKIAKRKQRRKQMLVTCIPLVLVAMFAVYRPVPQFPADITEPGTVTEDLLKDDQNSVILSAVQIDVSGGEGMQSCTDTGKIMRICDILEGGMMQAQSQSNAPEPAPEGSESARSDGEWDDIVHDSVCAGYIIMVSMNDGSTVTYCLEGNTLENRTTEEISLLTLSQSKELKLLLGIPISTAP